MSYYHSADRASVCSWVHNVFSEFIKCCCCCSIKAVVPYRDRGALLWSGNGTHSVDRMDRGEHSRQIWALRLKIVFLSWSCFHCPAHLYTPLPAYTELGSHDCLYPATSWVKPKVHFRPKDTFSFGAQERQCVTPPSRLQAYVGGAAT